MGNSIKEVFPYLRVSNGKAAIEFYEKAFGATVHFRLDEPSGRVAHSELMFGEAIIMLSDEYPEFGIHAPAEDAKPGASVHLHVDDVDSMANAAVAAGATMTMEPVDQFYGERSAKVIDPFGHEWHLGSQIEELSNEEIANRFQAMFEQSNS